MSDNNFDTNLLRFIASGTYVYVLMQVSRELFGKSYFVLSATEKAAVDQTANSTIGANFQEITPQFLGGHAKNHMGFEAPKDETMSGVEKK